MVTSETGQITSLYDYIPFGEEMIGVAGRGALWGASDAADRKFTAKERDVETGLDYFGARYMSSVQGRFTSPDPYEIVRQKDQGKTEEERRSLLNSYISNPQAWNKYAYALNNPLQNIDVGGKCSAPAGLKVGQTGVCIETFIAAKHIGGIGLGDNRTFSPYGGSYRFRVDVRIDPGPKGQISINSDAAKSSVLVEGLGFKGRGTASLSPVTTDEIGNRTFTVSGSAVNGEQFINKYVPLFNPAPQGDINFDLTFTVSPGGNVTLDTADSRTFPSLEIYSYDSSGNVKQDVFSFSERNPSDLTKPKQCIGGADCSR
jgi:RHS repeat-associated protein